MQLSRARCWWPRGAFFVFSRRVPSVFGNTKQAVCGCWLPCRRKVALRRGGKCRPRGLSVCSRDVSPYLDFYRILGRIATATERKGGEATWVDPVREQDRRSLMRQRNFVRTRLLSGSFSVSGF